MTYLDPWALRSGTSRSKSFITASASTKVAKVKQSNRIASIALHDAKAASSHHMAKILTAPLPDMPHKARPRL